MANFTDAARHFAAAEGVSDAATGRLVLVVEELVSNILLHGGTVPITIEMSLGAMGGSVRIDLCDDARPFDPFSQPVPTMTGDLDDQPIGGLGIALVRAFATQMEYMRHDGRNHVELYVGVAAAK